MSDAEFNPYTTPKTSRSDNLNDKSHAIGAPPYLRVFAVYAIIPWISGPMFARAFRFLAGDEAWAYMFMAYAVGWALTLPYALFMLGIVRLLVELKLMRNTVVDILLLCIITALIWFLAVYNFELYEPRIKWEDWLNFAYIFLAPALLASIIAGVVFNKYLIKTQNPS